MSDTPRHMGRDLTAIGLSALALFLAVALLTHDPADLVDTPVWPLSLIYSPTNSVHPTNQTIHNACGYWGALVSSAMLQATGIGASILVLCLGALAGNLLIRGGMNAPAMRSLGATIVLVAIVTAATLAPWRPDGMPIIGPGGYLGAMTSTWLGEHFAVFGTWILTLTLLAFGTLLTTDYVLLQAGRAALASGAAASAGSIRRVRGVLPSRHREPFTDGAEQAGEVEINDEASTTAVEPEPGEPAIKIRGRQLDDLATASDADADAESIPEPAEPPAANESFEDELEHEEEPSEETPEVRTVTVAGEETMVRQDPPHPEPKVKVRTPKRAPDERQQVFDNVSESLPEGVDEYFLPSLELLTESDDICYDDQLREVRRKAQILEETFKSFGFDVRVVEIETGPVIAQYEIALEAGLRLSKITGLADDVAIALRVPSVRIVAPIPGKNTVGVEVPNETRQVVRLREVIEEAGQSTKKMNIPIFLGKDVSGNAMTVDLAKMPHLLIAGRTGTGKSVCLNAIIASILMTCRPDEVRMLMIDPKMVELSGYGRLPHLMHPVITDMKKAEAILAWAVDKMEERYSLLAKAGVRHINSYNDLGRDEIARRLEIDDAEQMDDVPDHLPFIVIVADEMADLMMTAGKDVEQHIIRLAQKSRAVGIHLILATQKPTVDVITGLIKSNLPARLSFQVASKTDSRVVLDENGADKLLGNGDMLFLWPGTSTLIRGQGTFLSDEEIDTVCAHCSNGGEQNFVGELMTLKVDDEGSSEPVSADSIRARDDLYESAVDVVIREGRGSCSLLQRNLGIGYGRAARLIDFMAEDGIVGHYNGSKARDVIMTVAEWEAMQGIEPSGNAADDDDLPEEEDEEEESIDEQEAEEEYEEEWEDV
ncbi:FtsK/SpoIIIE family DNA translocase [Roseimaritima ulvae]|uniref:DNA translocase FtsK n=1 Tax=Roseimaritima ulvae TaxID=980254 RepID=A0A5B9QUF5_9BACT|nr:DNA translocase FtsK [Roseimaritima ulvae]QEG42668.1 DNA translocase FtsK [Roseimaritima ulvae]